MEDSDLLLCILNKNNNMFIGKMTFRNLWDDKPEIGIDIIENYRRQGYVFQAISLFVEKLKSISPIEICTVRIYSDNIPSKNLFKKFDIHEIERKDSEFTIIMNELKKISNEEYEAIRKNNAERFNAESERKIIKYHMFI